jgi:hypothetical protein
MKTFHCDECQNLVFFENNRCLNCGHALAYLPDQTTMAAVPQNSDGVWRPKAAADSDQSYRLCANYQSQHVCNWAVPQSDPESLCQSCRLTHVIPDLSRTGQEVWYRLEVAKRRLIYGLLSLHLPLSKQDANTPAGVSFSFLENAQGPNGDSGRVLTGHNNGIITINIEEVDDIKREQQRLQHKEPYRTLLGHFRHEIGHYYWDRLIAGTAALEAFRAKFGDEREDYAAALQRHYSAGPPADWADRFISAYATCHPWEDWAESWAHFMHITDSLETAGAIGLSLTPRRPDEPTFTARADIAQSVVTNFDRMIEEWLPLSYVLNNLNRGLGLADSYPFVLSPPAIDKLRFVHDTVVKAGLGNQNPDVTAKTVTVAATAANEETAAVNA